MMTMSTKKGRISKAADIVEYRPKPSLKIYSSELPMVKDLKVGETRTFLVTAKVRSLYSGDSEYMSDYDDDDKDKKSVCATLRVTDIKEE
jgi:hypothetical protein